MRPPEVIPLSKYGTKPTAQTGDTLFGVVCAGSAYFLWGMLPLYMKALQHVPAIEVVAHRAFWSLPVALIILIFLKRTNDILPTLKAPKKMGILLVCAIVVSINWGLYVWSVSVGRTVEAALGYYINPLITVSMGAIFLGEKLALAQKIAVGIAAMAVLVLTIMSGAFPWIALVLAFSFATYGLLRKTVDVGPTQGFFVEVFIMSFIALPYIVWLQTTGQGHLTSSTTDTLLLLGCGPATAFPLILYAFGAKGLRLATIGMMQYIAPTMIFLVSVFIFGEPFGVPRGVAFALIWIALAIFTTSMVRTARKSKALESKP